MKAFLISIFIFSASFVWAGEYTISPMVPDLMPGDGFMEAGSSSNPYVMTTDDGTEIGTIESEVPDLAPGDGFMEQGSFSNPWILTTPD